MKDHFSHSDLHAVSSFAGASSVFSECQETYKELIENISGVFWLLDLSSNKLLYVSAKYREIWGRDVENLLNDSEDWLCAVHKDDRDRVERAFFHSVAKKIVYREEFRIVRPNGETRWISDKGFPIFDGNGKYCRYGGVAEDITDQKSLEEAEKKTLLLAAESKNKTEFIAKVSHELRTPLTAIEGFADIIANAPDIPPKYKNMVDIQLRNCKHLHKMIDDLLDIAKLSSGHLAFDCSKFCLNEELSDAVELIRPAAQEKGLEIYEEYSNLSINVETDQYRFRQILINLLSNAVKFTDAGQVTIKTSVETKDKSSSFASIIVSDTGCGIESTDKLFTSFHREKKVELKGIPGFGIGLHLSKEIAEEMGGKLELLETKPQQGSTFKLSIPFVHAKALAKKAKTFSKRRKEINLTGKNVLVADDSPDIRELVKVMLASCGATVTTCDNGQSAIEKALEGTDIVLMDVSMPEMDGCEATTKLRLSGFSKPILALTAHAYEKDKRRCLAAGCNGFLTKPITKSQLAVAVSTHL